MGLAAGDSMVHQYPGRYSTALSNDLARAFVFDLAQILGPDASGTK